MAKTKMLLLTDMNKLFLYDNEMIICVSTGLEDKNISQYTKINKVDFIKSFGITALSLQANQKIQRNK